MKRRYFLGALAALAREAKAAENAGATGGLPDEEDQ